MPNRRKYIENIKRIISICVIWVVCMIFYFTLIFFTIGEVAPDKANIYDFFISTFFIAALLGIINGILEVFIFQSKFQKMKFMHVVIAKTFYFFIAFIITVVLFILFKNNILFPLGIVSNVQENEIIEFFTSSVFYKHGFFTIIISFGINFFIQVNRKMGKGVLFDMFLGRYHLPRQKDRIIMFLDLSSSTTIAEKLGDHKYSSFIKDFFYDLEDAISETDGAVYQYVGDGAIIIWNLDAGIQNTNCIKCFTLAQEKIESRKDTYLKNYDVYPKFKAGIHAGKVVISEVGGLKSEIAFHGDSMNIAARLCSACSEHNKELLISADLLGLLSDIDDDYTVDVMGIVNLKGKDHAIGICSVERKN